MKIENKIQENEPSNQMTENGPIEKVGIRHIMQNICPACKERRIHNQKELDIFHKNRIGVDDRDIRRIKS